MSVIDKVVAAVAPPESDEARAQARTTALGAAEPGSWFAMVLEHHQLLEAAFAEVRDARDATARTAALKHLGLVLTGHAIAEESVLYPAMSTAHQTGHADMGYTEQAMVKMQMAALEALDPLSQDFDDKLEHIRGAVAHHMYEEEGTWFLDLSREAPQADQGKLTMRYKEEWDRYTHGEATTAKPAMAF